MDTSKFPRATSPLTLPDAHASGSAGSILIYPMLLCRSISATPDVIPKFPSIWNGGCVSQRLVIIPFLNRSVISLYARFPSDSLAHVLIRCPIPQPVLSSVRLFMDTLAASKYSGVSDEIRSPGKSPSIWEICLCPYPCPILFTVVSSYHSLICPLSPISIGPFNLD